MERYRFNANSSSNTELVEGLSYDFDFTLYDIQNRLITPIKFDDGIPIRFSIFKTTPYELPIDKNNAAPTTPTTPTNSTNSTNGTADEKETPPNVCLY